MHYPIAWVICCALGLAAITALIVRARHACPWQLVGWLWFLGTLVPVIGLVQVGAQARADRYMYLPLVGLVLAVVWSMVDWVTRRRLPNALPGTLLAVGLVCLMAVTRHQLGHWRTTETLFAHTLNVTTNNWLAHYTLGLVALDRYQQAQLRLTETMKLGPDSFARSVFGADLDAQHELREMVAQSDRALHIKPDFAPAHRLLGRALVETEELPRAEIELRAALAAMPSDPETHQNLAEVFSRQGRAKEAIAHYKLALERRPDWAPVLNNLAWLLATNPDPEVRKGEEAVEAASRACELSGQTNLFFLHTLAAAHAERGDFAQAISTAEAACRLAETSGQSNLIQTARGRVEAYRAGKCLRAP